MAEVTSSSSSDTFSKASVNTATSVVAPPKFVFGSGMSERVKKSDDEDSDASEKEEEQATTSIDFLEYASAALKRSAGSDDDSADFSCPDFSFVPKKMKKKESPEPKAGNVLRPSALSDIANKLTNTKQDKSADGKSSESGEQDEKSAKTFGECSNSSTSSESLTSLSRPHLIDTPAPLNTGVKSENYFQQFLSGNSSSSSSESKGSFVFGQNIRDRVNMNVDSSDSNTADKSSKISEEGESPQSLAELANKGSESSVEAAQSSIAVAAQKYESEHSPQKQNLAEVHVMTGEEDERNVLQVNCRLFTFCTQTHSWLGRGRIILKLNDHCQLNSEGTFHSRLVARTQGSLRLVLNTKLWPEMVIEKASERAIRVSAMEDGKIQLYLIMAAAREASQLYTAIDRRIETLKRNQVTPNERQDSEEELTETKSVPEENDEVDEEIKKDDNVKEPPNQPDSPTESEKNVN